MIVPKADRLGAVKEYYFVKKLEEIRQLREQGHDVINFGIGSPDLPPSEAATQALSETATVPENHGYQAYKGIPELRQAMSNWYRNTYGVPLDPATEILPLMGSKEGILHLTMAFVNEGDEVLVPNPGYPTYASVTRLAQGVVRNYDLHESSDWQPDFEALDAMDLSKVKVMWVNYPHMPTGAPARKTVFEQLIAFAHRHRILICHDNPYSLVLNDTPPLSLLHIDGAKEVAIELNSLSKSHNMAGWRVGMLAGGAAYLNEALRVKSNIDSGMFLGTQRAAIASLNNPDEWHVERNNVYRERRTWVYQLLDQLGFEYNPAHTGMFVWAKPKPGNDTGDIETYIDRLLNEKHIFITPGFIFGTNGNGYIRLSLCVPLDKIKEACGRLSK